jgi:2-amino-4-hydroxy-6-hydroxymethyldihydropteridine diphosphokinase
MKDRAFVLMPLIDVAPDYRIEDRALKDWLGQADSAGIEIADESRDWWRQT